MTEYQRTGKRLFFSGMTISFLAVFFSFKLWSAYHQHAKWLWWQGRFMNPLGHALYLQLGVGMIAFGYAFLAFMGLLRWRAR